MAEPTDETLETEPPARRRFILARLAEAVRRQDWFTVIIEITVVVLGVVIGFQVTAWGQSRSDRVKEQTYLRQLAADMRDTEDQIESANASSAHRMLSGASLYRSFRAVERPPRDSLVEWRRSMNDISRAVPITGTAEALIATGDLALIRNDSLRTAITRYVSELDVLKNTQSKAFDVFVRGQEQLDTRVDYADVLQDAYPPAVFDSLARSTPEAGLQAGVHRRPFPFTVEGVLTDRAAYDAVRQMWLGQQFVANQRQRILKVTRELRTLVEANIGK